MPPPFDELIKNRYFQFFLISYTGYLFILFLLALPYIPEMLTTNGNEGDIYMNPILVFGVAAVTPVIIVFIIVNYKLFVTPLLSLNSRVMILIVIYFLLQFGENFLLAICLIIMKPNDITLSEYISRESLIIWIIGLSFSIFSFVLNMFIGWKWVKKELEHPLILHWLVGLIVYFFFTTFGVICIHFLNSSVQGILLWPFSGIIILGSLNIFIVLFGLFTVVMESIVSTTFSGQSDAIIGFYFMVIIFFLGFALLLPIIYILTFLIGTKLANLGGKNST